MRTEATAALACAVGCTVRSIADPIVRLDCPSGWSAARLLLELARADKFEPVIQRLAARFSGETSGDESYARAVQDFVQASIRFVREVGEVFQSPLVTLTRRAGDCDCHARLIYALLEAGGVPARLAFLHRGGNPIHVVVQAYVGGAWAWLETTIKGARFGEHPIKAATRLGRMRADIAQGMRVITMGALKIEGGGVYAVRIGLLEDGADLVGALAEMGFEATRVFDAPPPDFPVMLAEPVSCAPVTAWAEAVALRPGAGVAVLPLEHNGLVFEDFVLLRMITLPPALPFGAKPASSPAVVASDASMLRKLGYAVPEDVTSPLDVRLRSAIASLQRKLFPRAGTIDGLPGPTLRATMRGLLGVDRVSHADAARIVSGAWVRVHGREPSPNELLLTQAVAFAENGYGRAGQFAAFAARGAFNWGSLERSNPSGGPCPPGFVSGNDLGTVCFEAHPSDEAAAERFVGLLTLTRRWRAIEAMSTGDPSTLARAMRAQPAYYGGFPSDTEEQKIARYTRGLSNAIAAIRSGGGGIPDATPVILVLVALASAIGYALKT